MHVVRNKKTKIKTTYFLFPPPFPLLNLTPSLQTPLPFPSGSGDGRYSQYTAVSLRLCLHPSFFPWSPVVPPRAAGKSRLQCLEDLLTLLLLSPWFSHCWFSVLFFFFLLCPFLNTLSQRPHQHLRGAQLCPAMWLLRSRPEPAGTDCVRHRAAPSLLREGTCSFPCCPHLARKTNTGRRKVSIDRSD